MPKRTKSEVSTPPQAKLSAIIKTAREAMRKDAVLNGDLDRIPQLADRKYHPVIASPHR